MSCALSFRFKVNDVTFLCHNFHLLLYISVNFHRGKEEKAFFRKKEGKVVERGDHRKEVKTSKKEVSHSCAKGWTSLPSLPKERCAHT